MGRAWGKGKMFNWILYKSECYKKERDVDIRNDDISFNRKKKRNLNH